MELVKFNLQGGVVTIHVVIEGLIAWRYVYAAEDRQFIKTSSEAGPCMHTLGFPHELNNDINNWDIQVANIGNEELSYVARIFWVQDGNPLHTWEKEGSVPPNEVKVETGSALIVGITEETEEVVPA